MLVVHSELKRLADVEAALAGVEINILGFIVIQQVIRVARVIIRFGQPDGQFIVCHVSFSGKPEVRPLCSRPAVKAYLLKSTGWWKKVFSSSVFIRITFKFEIITLLKKGCKNNCFRSDEQRTRIAFLYESLFFMFFCFSALKNKSYIVALGFVHRKICCIFVIRNKDEDMAQPLAERLRPKTLDDYIGQKHLVGPGAVLRKMIDAGRISSFILWGPPGVGKTTLAQIIANKLETPFYTLSAVTSGVKDVRDVIEKARSNRFFSQASPILFIDEIHRFSKSQQDSLLGAVETGVVTLIGATTENPSFEVIRPLLSRCQLYVLKSLEKEDLLELLHNAIAKDVILKEKKIELKETDAMLRFSGGDARKLLNILELVVEADADAGPVVITDEKVTERLQQNPLAYDKDGEMHYDIISAFIKSIRGSDPDGALYWLARMVEAGEDPAFIARRLVISAAEDIGLANPNALLLANAAFDAVMKIGWPEGRIPLAEATVYLATSPKSNSAYEGINSALELVRQTGNLPVPLHLRNAPTKLMKQLGYGKDYKYAHAYQGNFVQQQFLPDEVKGSRIWHPQNNAQEAKIRERMQSLWGERFKE